MRAPSMRPSMRGLSRPGPALIRPFEFLTSQTDLAFEALVVRCPCRRLPSLSDDVRVDGRLSSLSDEGSWRRRPRLGQALLMMGASPSRRASGMRDLLAPTARTRAGRFGARAGSNSWARCGCSMAPTGSRCPQLAASACSWATGGSGGDGPWSSGSQVPEPSISGVRAVGRMHTTQKCAVCRLKGAAAATAGQGGLQEG